MSPDICSHPCAQVNAPGALPVVFGAALGGAYALVLALALAARGATEAAERVRLRCAIYNGAPFHGALYIMAYCIMAHHLMVRYI